MQHMSIKSMKNEKQISFCLSFSETFTDSFYFFTEYRYVAAIAVQMYQLNHKYYYTFHLTPL